MPSRDAALAGLVVALTLGVTGCAFGAAAVPTPTPAILIAVATPFSVFLAAATPAELLDRPAGSVVTTVAADARLTVDGVDTTVDGELWYHVSAGDGRAGWLPAAAASLVGRPAAATPTARPTLPALPSPAAVATATPRPRPLVVIGSGLGLFLRRDPGTGTVIRSYPDGTVVTPLGPTTTLDGRRWAKVRTPDGQEGWMATEYLRPASP